LSFKRVKEYGFGLGQVLESFGGNLSQIWVAGRDSVGMDFSRLTLEGGIDLPVCSVLGYA